MSPGRRLVFNLHSTASAVTVVADGNFARFVYAILEPGMTGTRQPQIGSAVMACNVLRDTQMPIQQIAESVRFSSAANFATAFRHRTGMTPSEYRRQAVGS